MSKNESLPPHLMQAFDTVVDWLQLDVPLSTDEILTLKASFVLAAENETALMVVSSRTRTVTISDQKACWMDIPKGKENKLSIAGKGRVGSSIDRDGFFLFNVVAEADPFAAAQRKSILDIIYEAAPPERRMFLGT